jgi:hypothetical protein
MMGETLRVMIKEALACPDFRIGNDQIEPDKTDLFSLKSWRAALL